MKVLVIEDEKKIASLVRKGLEAQAFVVDVSGHGDEGFTLATTGPYDVAILDIMLPGKDGLSILHNLRERKILYRSSCSPRAANLTNASKA